MDSDIIEIERCKEKLLVKEEDKLYKNLIELLLKNGLYNEAVDYCDKYMKFHQCEDSYLLKLKYLYMTKDESGFKKLLEEFIYSPVRLSDRGNAFVRFWIE